MLQGPRGSRNGPDEVFGRHSGKKAVVVYTVEAAAQAATATA